MITEFKLFEVLKDDGYHYLPVKIEKEIENDYSDDILKFILNVDVDSSFIRDARDNNWSFSTIVSDLNFKDIRYKIREEYSEYKTVYVMNSFYTIVEKIFNDNVEEISENFNKKIIEYFKQNKQYYIDNYEYLELSEEIESELEYILKANEFNL